MKAEATTLRASGSDPNNPKVLGVNLQKAQLVAMIIALINCKSNDIRFNGYVFFYLSGKLNEYCFSCKTY